MSSFYRYWSWDTDSLNCGDERQFQGEQILAKASRNLSSMHHCGPRGYSPCWEKHPCRDFSGGPLAKTLHSQSRGFQFNPWSGNLIPRFTAKIWCREINIKKKKRPLQTWVRLWSLREKPTALGRSRVAGNWKSLDGQLFKSFLAISLHSPNNF